MTTQPDPTEVLRGAVSDACQAAGEGYSELLAAFIGNGPGPATSALLDSVNAVFDDLNIILGSVPGQPGVAQLQESVRLYLLGNAGLSILYAEGETAYQARVPPDERDVVVHAEAESQWEAGVLEAFGAESPTPPTAIFREC